MINDIVTDLTSVGEGALDTVVDVFLALLPILLPLFIGIGIIVWLWVRAKSFGK